jgi:hypothetical protein
LPSRRDTVTANPAFRAAIATIGDTAWTPVWYPEAVLDPDTSELISDAEVADTVYTAFTGTRHEIAARLVVRRVKDKSHAAALFPVRAQVASFTAVGPNVFATGNAAVLRRVRALEASWRPVRPRSRCAGIPPAKPMHIWQLDFVGGVPLADGRHRKIATSVDDHSRFLVIYAVLMSGRKVCVTIHVVDRDVGVQGFL